MFRNTVFIINTTYFQGTQMDSKYVKAYVSILNRLTEEEGVINDLPKAQPNVNQLAQQAGNAIKQFTPQLMKGVANDVRTFKGQDPTKNPEYAKLSPQQQQQWRQAQQTIDASNPDEVEKFDANQAASNIQGMAKSVVNPNNMPSATLKPTQYADGVAPSNRKTASDYPPATVGGKPAAPATTATAPKPAAPAPAAPAPATTATSPTAPTAPSASSATTAPATPATGEGNKVQEGDDDLSAIRRIMNHRR